MTEIDWKARAEAAEAREAVLREALARWEEWESDEDRDPDDYTKILRAVADALYSTTAAAAARDARIREEGRRAGIEEAIRRIKMQPLVADDGGIINVVLLNLRSLLDKPAWEDGR